MFYIKNAIILVLHAMDQMITNVWIALLPHTERSLVIINVYVRSNFMT